MKARIIRYERLGKVRYHVQYKRLLFWHTCKDAGDCYLYYHNIEEAKAHAAWVEAKIYKLIMR